MKAEVLIVEWGVEQLRKKLINVPCTAAVVDRLFIGDGLIDTFHQRDEFQRYWEIQMAVNVALVRATGKYVVNLSYNDILSSSFFKQFEEIYKNEEANKNSTLPVIHPILKQKLNYGFGKDMAPSSVADHLEKVDMVADADSAVNEANKANKFTEGKYYTTSWLTKLEVWKMLRGYMEMPLDLDLHEIAQCYALKHLHAKVQTLAPKSPPHIVTLPMSSIQKKILSRPSRMKNQDKWCGEVTVNSDCWGFGDKRVRSTRYEEQVQIHDKDLDKMISQESVLRNCEHVKIKQREHFVELI